MAPLVTVRNHASCQILVESTKGLHNFMSSPNQLERIKLDSKSARRKEKDDKKEKRKHKHSSKKAKVLSSKKVSDESEQLESSDLTQELNEPQKDLGYLSDGSQNSKKRKRDDSPPAVESSIKAAPVAGKPLRIRFVYKGLKVDESPSLPCEDSAVSLDNREKVVQAVVKSSVPCLKQSEPREILSLPDTSAIAVAETKKVAPVSVLDSREKVAQAVVMSSVPCAKVPEPVKNLPSTSAVVETKKRKKHRPSKEERYNALFDNWEPSPICLPILEIDSSNEDDDWLVGNRRTQEKLNPRAVVQDMNTSLLQNKAGEVSCWPRAQLLPEVGIYSLPYTVPF